MMEMLILQISIFTKEEKLYLKLLKEKLKQKVKDVEILLAINLHCNP